MRTCTIFTVHQVPFEYFEVGETCSTYDAKPGEYRIWWEDLRKDTTWIHGRRWVIR